MSAIIVWFAELIAEVLTKLVVEFVTQVMTDFLLEVVLEPIAVWAIAGFKTLQILITALLGRGK